MVALHVDEIGNGPRVVLVHGSMGYPSWRKQRPLAERFRLEMLTRPGYPPNPPEPTLDFERDAELVANHLADGAHLVGHSYGGVICLLAAALRPEALLSLTVAEPPCFAVARCHPAVEDFVASAKSLQASGPHEPRTFVESYMGLIGMAAQLPDPMPAEALQCAQAWMVERAPWEAQIPLADLCRAPYPKLVVSGAKTHPALAQVCDVLERELRAQRAVLPNTDHRIMGSPTFNGLLEEFLSN